MWSVGGCGVDELAKRECLVYASYIIDMYHVSIAAHRLKCTPKNGPGKCAHLAPPRPPSYSVLLAVVHCRAVLYVASASSEFPLGVVWSSASGEGRARLKASSAAWAWAVAFASGCSAWVSLSGMIRTAPRYWRAYQARWSALHLGTLPPGRCA